VGGTLSLLKGQNSKSLNPNPRENSLKIDSQQINPYPNLNFKIEKLEWNENSHMWDPYKVLTWVLTPPRTSKNV